MLGVWCDLWLKQASVPNRFAARVRAASFGNYLSPKMCDYHADFMVFPTTLPALCHAAETEDCLVDIQ